MLSVAVVGSKLMLSIVVGTRLMKVDVKVVGAVRVIVELSIFVVVIVIREVPKLWKTEVIKTVEGMAVVIIWVNVRSTVVGIKLVRVVMRVVGYVSVIVELSISVVVSVTREVIGLVKMEVL
jgi:hypothetical protein